MQVFNLMREAQFDPTQHVEKILGRIEQGEVHEYANGPQRTVLFRVRYGGDMLARHKDWRGRPGWTQSAADAEYFKLELPGRAAGANRKGGADV